RSMDAAGWGTPLCGDAGDRSAIDSARFRRPGWRRLHTPRAAVSPIRPRRRATGPRSGLLVSRERSAGSGEDEGGERLLGFVGAGAGDEDVVAAVGREREDGDVPGGEGVADLGEVAGHAE